MESKIDVNATSFEMCGCSFPLVGIHLPNTATVKHSFDEGHHSVSKSCKDTNECDFTILIGEKTIHANKEFLRSRIPFFRDLFNSNMVECQKRVINLSSKFCDFELATIESLLDYARSGILIISTENAQDLLLGANFLRIESAIKECGEFVRRRLTVENILPLYKSIAYHGIDSYLLRFIDANFVYLSFTHEFLELSIDDLVNFLKRDSLNIDDEIQVFNAVTRWIEFDINRKVFAAKLLECVRCRYFSIDFISTTVEKSEWIMNNSECREVVEEAKNKKMQNNFDWLSNRVCSDAHVVFLVFRSVDDSPDFFTYQFYDPMTNSYTDLQSISIPYPFGFVGWDGRERKLVLSRELDTEANETPMEAYALFNTKTNEWYTDASHIDHDPSVSRNLSKKRYGSTLTWADGNAYMIGGSDNEDNTISSSVEKCDSIYNEWTMVAPMSIGRFSPCAVQIDGKIYVIGGALGDDIHTNSGERYDPETDRWTPIAPMAYNRTAFTADVINKKIYVAGGNDGTQSLDTVERYDPISDQWTTLKSMMTKRTSHSSGVSFGKLFVFGGVIPVDDNDEDDDDVEDEQEKLHEPIVTVEMYDPETDIWAERRPMQQAALSYPISIPAKYPTPAPNLEDIWSNGFLRFQLKDELLRAIVECGFIVPTTVQLECIPLAIEGKDVMCERDSSGKTSSFVISTLHNLEPIDGIVSILVVVPNREMASTIVAEYHRFSKYLKPVKIGEFVIPIKRSEKLFEKESPNIVVGTPLRIVHLMKTGKFKFDQIEHLVLDGCDQMIEDKDTRNAIKNIIQSTTREKQILSYGVVNNKTKKFLQDNTKRRAQKCF